MLMIKKGIFLNSFLFLISVLTCCQPVKYRNGYANLFYGNPQVRCSKELVIAKDISSIYPELTIDELTAIHFYTSKYAYKELNQSLRKLKGRIRKMTCFNQVYFSLLQSGLKKVPNKFAGKLYRGTSLSDTLLRKYKNALLKKKVVREWAFTSSNISSDVRRFQYFSKTDVQVPVLFIINAIGCNGAEIGLISAYGKNFIPQNEKVEQEVLFRSGTCFKVIGYQERLTSLGHMFVEIEMTEIVNDKN